MTQAATPFPPRRRPWSLVGILVALSLSLLACTTDSYDKGEGSYSLMQAHMVDAHIDGKQLVDYIATDDGDTLQLAPPLQQTWTQTTDTFCRALFYFNKTASRQAQPLSATRIGTAAIVPRDSLKEGMKTHPVKLESIWLAKTRRYLNVGLYLKVGTTDREDARHRLAVIADTLQTRADGTVMLHLSLYHDQGGVPEYYSQRTFFSIPLYQLQADSVSLTVHTYQGAVVRQFGIR